MVQNRAGSENDRLEEITQGGGLCTAHFCNHSFAAGGCTSHRTDNSIYGTKLNNNTIKIVLQVGTKSGTDTIYTPKRF